MQIRPATEDDILHLVGLHGYRDEVHFRGAIKQMSRGEGVLLVAEDQGRIVGVVNLHYYGTRNHDYPSMTDLRVHQDARGQGIGSELIAVCEHLSAVKGFNMIGISVNPTLNSGARRLYERLGYIPVSKTPYLDGQVNGQENWVIDMTKRITPIT